MKKKNGVEGVGEESEKVIFILLLSFQLKCINILDSSRNTCYTAACKESHVQ